MRFIVSSEHQVLYDCQVKIGQHIPKYLVIGFHNFSDYVFMFSITQRIIIIIIIIILQTVARAFH